MGKVARGIKHFFAGKPEAQRLFESFAPDQQAAVQQLLQMAMQEVQPSAQRQFDFEPIAQQARTQFQEQTIPAIAQRFASIGGGLESSAFPRLLGQAGAGLEESLAALGSKYNLAQQGLQQQRLGTLLQAGLAPRFQSVFSTGTPGLLGGGSQLLGLGGGLGLLKLFGLL